MKVELNILKVDINLLKEHPLNTTIYGVDDEEQFNILVNRIKEYGFIEPIITNKEWMILSGHRRYRAAKLLGYTSIDCEKVSVPPEQELEILLNSNVYREKTTVQKLKEAEYYHEIESRKALLRQLSGVTLETSRTQGGRTDEIVAEKIGMSPSSYKRGKKALKNTEKLVNPVLKWFLEGTANEDITSAEKLLEQPEEVIQQVYDLTGGDPKQVGKVLRNLENLKLRENSPIPPGKYTVIYTEYGNEDDFENFSKIQMSDIADSASFFKTSLTLITESGWVSPSFQRCTSPILWGSSPK